MNKEKDYASDTDESDDDFRPDNLAGESPASEEEETEADSEAPEENDNDAGKKPAKSKRCTKKVIKKKRTKNKKNNDESDDDEDSTEEEHKYNSRRATRQTDDVLSNGKGKTLEKDELVSDEEDKTRTNALWADFLKDVNPKASSSKANNTNAEENKQESLANEKQILNSKIEAKDQHNESSTKSKQEESKKSTVTEVLDFAGEEVHIEREVDASNIKENKAATTQPVKKQPFGRIMPGAGIKRTMPSAGPGVSGGGIGSFLNQLGKKKKISVLEKSQMDWNSFKQTEGIDEQLQTFNKGKDG